MRAGGGDSCLWVTQTGSLYSAMQNSPVKSSAVYISPVQCSAVQSSPVQCSSAHCIAVQNSALQFSAVQGNVDQGSSLQYIVIQCSNWSISHKALTLELIHSMKLRTLSQLNVTRVVQNKPFSI